MNMNQQNCPRHYITTRLAGRGYLKKISFRRSLFVGFRFIALSVLLVTLIFLPTARGALIDGASLAQLTARSGGIVFLPETKNSEAAVALAEKGPFIVLAQSNSEEIVTETKKRAALAGVLSKKLFAIAGSPASFPFAPNSVTVVLVNGVGAKEVNDTHLDSWLAALAPERGVLILEIDGKKPQETEALRKLLASRRDVFLRESPEKAFLFAGKHPVQGSDMWTHKFHNPANTRTSLDQTLNPPFLPAWYALPTHLGYWGDTMVADHGRAYHVWANRAFVNSVSLRCYDLRSGQLLWERPFAWDGPRENNSAGYYPGRSCMVVVGDNLALIDGPDVLLLDGETGAEKSRIPGPLPDGQIKWLAREGNTLAVLAGAPDTFSTAPLQQISRSPYGRHLAVYDLAGNKPLWSEVEEGDIDEREIALLNGRLYYHVHREDAANPGVESKTNAFFAKPTKGIKVACRELATGKAVWENRDAETLAALNEPTERNLHELLISLRGLAATPQVLYFSTALSKRAVALATQDGRLLWSEDTSKHTGRSAPDILWGDNVIRRGAGGEGLYSLLTNEKVGPARVVGDSCGPPFMVGDKIFGAFGTVWNPEDGKVLRRMDLKSPCDVGVIVSSGVAISPASTCTCALEIHGFRAFTHDPGPLPSENASAERLVRGSAFGRPLLPEGDLATQWPTFRHDTRRSGATAARVPESPPSEKWRWSPPTANPVIDPKPTWNMRYLEVPEHLPTQSIAVNGTVFFADSQGVVRALDLQTGAERWSFPIGSKVTISPQWHRGRLLVGAADGTIYCVDAADGALAWSYRVPDRQRLIAWYGHLASTWPVLGGLACADGIAYALAGFQSGNGLFATALDLATGKELWQSEIREHKIGLAGLLALDEERILFHPGGIAPAALDRRTGELILPPQSELSGADRVGELTFGRDVAVLPTREIIYGGKRIYDDFSAWAKPAKMLYTLCKPDFEVSPAPLRNIGADLIEGSMTPPVFDTEQIVLARPFAGHKQAPQMQLWPLAELRERLAALPDGAPRFPWINKQVPFSFGSLVEKGSGLPEGGLWKEAPELPAYAMALSANALLVVHPRDGKLESVKDWNLSALRRDDAQVLWSIELPGRLAWDGLSIAKDGSIMLSFWNGSVATYSAQ